MVVDDALPSQIAAVYAHPNASDYAPCRWEGPREEGYDDMREATRNEPVVPFPPPAHSAASHPFASLTIA
jgi:hypothetical protein